MANQTCNPSIITQALGITATGPRTVIVPADPIIWDEATSYEYLTLVASADFGQGYVAKKDVPSGTPLTNTEYWIPVASFNAQLSHIQEQVSTLTNDIDTYRKNDPIYYGADPTGAEDSSSAISECIAANKGGTVVFTPGTYKINQQVNTPYTANERVSIDLNGSVLVCENNISTMLYVGGEGADPSVPSLQSMANVPFGFVGNGTIVSSSVDTCAIRIAEHYQQFYVKNIVFLVSGTSVKVADTDTYSSDVDIVDCYVLNETASNNPAIILNSNDNNVINLRTICRNNPQIMCNGYAYFDNVHILTGIDNNSNNGIEFAQAIKLNNFYADNVGTALKYTGQGQANISCINGFAFNYSHMSNSVFIDVTASASSPLVSMVGCQLDTANTDNFVSVKFPSSVNPGMYANSFNGNVVANIQPTKADATLISNVPRLYGLSKANEWCHIGYVFCTSYQPIYFLVLETNYIYIIQVEYNGTSPVITKRDVTSGSTGMEFGASVISANPMGGGTIIELCAKNASTYLPPMSVVSTTNSVFLAQSYNFVDATDAVQTPSVTA